MFEKITVKAPVYHEFAAEVESVIDSLVVFKLNLLSQHSQDTRAIQEDIQFIVNTITDLETMLDEYVERYYG